MTRAQQTISIGLLVTSLYLALYLQLVPLPELVQTEIVPVVRIQSSFPPHPHISHIQPTLLVSLPTASPHRIPKSNPLTSVSQLPFWALVSFGAYLLFRLGWNVMTFHDVPEAHKELIAEIELAKKDLRRLGVEVD
ncbi:dolichol-phosphate mannosyltransferase subunit 3 [Xylaria digitata]|nr:dolichol-phosphate mannosyltransferase subunit 3 [Xylaria digitata]